MTPIDNDGIIKESGHTTSGDDEMTTAQVIGVVKADKVGATVNVDGRRQVIDWQTLRAAAKQNDAGLRSVYSDLLKEALRLAALDRRLTVVVNNRTNTPHGYEAELYDVAGEFVSGRIVAADFGLSGTREYAERDAATAIRTLGEHGYTVTKGRQP
jgi:hypothetical protein